MTIPATTGANHVNDIVAVLDSAATRNAGVALTHDRIAFLDGVVPVLRRRNRSVNRSKLVGALVDQFRAQWDSMSDKDRERLNIEI